MRAMLFFVLLIFHFVLEAQIIPSSRVVDWSYAGYTGEIPDPSFLLDVTDFGAIPDGITPADVALQLAIDSIRNHAGVVYFPTGKYLITSSIILSDSVVLRGAGSDSTRLIFDLGGAPNDCIDVSRNQTHLFTRIISAFEKGSTEVLVNDASDFSNDDYAELRQENGAWDISPSPNTDYAVGQILKIVSVSGNSLVFEPALRIDYDTSLNLEIRKIDPVGQVGVECMNITRRDSSSSPSVYNIDFQYAAECWVKGVESSKSMGAHIMIEQSAKIQVSGCFIHDAFAYDGVGTQGYGITLRQHTSDCLVENNILKHLRHALMVKEGANGNVFAYNYSIEPNRSEPIPDFSGDISSHGHYPYANLFEGNIVQNIIIDHARGPSGPFNTYFRNRAELYGIIITPDSLATSDQNFVGNEVANSSLLHGNYVLSGTGHFEYANNVKGTILPVNISYLPDSSYYLTSIPDFWINGMDWPSIGIPFALNSGTIPAKARYQNGGKLTVCEFMPDTLATDIIVRTPLEFIKAYPNPFNEELNLQINATAEGTHYYIVLRDPAGKIIMHQTAELNPGENIIYLSPHKIASGMYFLEIEHDHHAWMTKVLKLNR